MQMIFGMSNQLYKGNKMDLKPVDERFYGRRHGKKLKGGKVFLMENLLPKIQMPKAEDMPKDLSNLFGFTPDEFWLEVGFGGGEHLAEQAKRNPNIAIIGAEPFLNGVASLLAHLNGSWGKDTDQTRLLEENRADNVRVYPDDIRHLFDSFANNSFDRIFILYPDPWPKSRHEDRRFAGGKNLPQLHRLLKTNGQLRIATDVQEYADWAVEQIEQSHLFKRINEDVRKPFDDWVSTRYEQKGLKAGRIPTYLIYTPIGKDENKA